MVDFKKKGGSALDQGVDSAGESSPRCRGGDLMAYSMRRWRLVAAALVAAIGFAAGIGYRFFIDSADERELANYRRSGVHGVGIALAGGPCRIRLARTAGRRSPVRSGGYHCSVNSSFARC